jgi:CheY-specific phosphatase CheX
MITAPTQFDLKTTVQAVVPNVFQTMSSLPITLIKAGVVPSGERISSTVGIASETVSGSVYLHFSEQLARRVTTAMLGLNGSENVDTSSVNDVVSELANMVGGGLKSVLADAGWPCGISTPAVVRGGSFVIELPKGLDAETFFFDCQGEALAVEVHLKLG